MYLLELAAQNVRGLSPTVRAALKPGYLLLKTPDGSPAQIAGLIASLCYPDGRGGDAAFAAPGQRAKVALTLLGNDQTTYRVIRELGGAGNLSRLNKASGAYEIVTEDSNDLAQFLRGQVGFPSRGTFENLFTFTAAALPSRRPRATAAAAKVPLGASGPKHGHAASPSLASMQAVAPASDVGAAEEKLRQLEGELVLSKEVEDLQFRIDGITSQLFELESRLKGSEGLKAALAQAEREHEAAPSVEQFGLPPDIVQRAEQYPKLEARRDEQLAKLDAEGPADDFEPQARYVEPLVKDQRFVGAVVAGVVFLGLGLAMQGMARYIALLDIPAFSFAAVLALRFVEEKEDAQRSTRKGGMRAAREKKIRDDFESEARVVRDAMKTLDVESPGDLVATLEKKALLLQKVEDYREQLRNFEADPEYSGAMDAQTQLRAQQEEMNAELTQKGAYVREAREVEREVQRVRESIQLARSGAGATHATAAAAAAALQPGEALPDPCPAILSAATDLLQNDIPTLAAASKDRIAQYVAALTDRRVVGVEFDMNGKATAVLANGSRTPAGLLPPKDLDILYLAVRLTLIEKVSARQKVPVLIEDGLAVDEPKYGLLARMVKHLGTLTQVVHVTSHAAFAQAADAQVPV